MSEEKKNIPETALSDDKLDAVTGGGTGCLPWEYESTIVYYKCPHCGEENSETTLETLHWTCAYCLKKYDSTAERREATYKVDTRNLPDIQKLVGQHR